MTNYKYEKKITPDPQIKDIADQFFNASKQLWKMPPGSGIVIPAIINSILSVELYLKSLISKSIIKNYENYGDGVYGGIVTSETDQKTKTHKLSMLFDNIENDLANDINHKFNKTDICKSYQNLKEYLSKNDSTFVKVRYLYEGNAELTATNTSELKQVAVFFHNYINNMSQTEKLIK